MERKQMAMARGAWLVSESHKMRKVEHYSGADSREIRMVFRREGQAATARERCGFQSISDGAPASAVVFRICISSEYGL